MANDSLKVERLERLANEWHNGLAKSMETETLAATPARRANGEVDFWRRHHVILSDLTESLSKFFFNWWIPPNQAVTEFVHTKTKAILKQLVVV